MLNKFGKQLGEFLECKNISIKEFAERDGVVCLPAGSEITLTRAIKY